MSKTRRKRQNPDGRDLPRRRNPRPQPPERIERIVKPAIDFVLALADAATLVEYCGDHTKPPEARLLAAAKIRAMHELAASDHRHRGVTAIDLEYVDACVTAFDSQRWRSPYHYGSLLEPGPAPGKTD